MHNLKVTTFFEAAHQLPDSPTLVTKECTRLHGHTYAVIIEVQKFKLVDGMVVDFRAIKNIVNILDHRFINDVFKEYDFKELDYNVEGPPVLKDIYPTTVENVAMFIHQQIKDKLGFSARILICEGYKGEQHSSWVMYQEER